MSFTDPPAVAAWQHWDARQGFEVVFITVEETGYRLGGHTTAVEGGQAWAVRYEITVDDSWITRGAQVWSWSKVGFGEMTLDSNQSGQWYVNGSHVPEFDGLLDVDLESSACTNTIPVHRLRLAVGESAEAPAVYVRAADLGVERLEQQYSRIGDDGALKRYDYRAPAFEFASRLIYDESGLVREYPGIASRVL